MSLAINGSESTKMIEKKKKKGWEKKNTILVKSNGPYRSSHSFNFSWAFGLQ